MSATDNPCGYYQIEWIGRNVTKFYEVWKCMSCGKEHLKISVK